MNRTVVLLVLLCCATVIAACRDRDPAGPAERPLPFEGDTLVGAPDALAAGTIPDSEYEPRDEDFSTNHTALPGFPVSHNTLVLVPAAGATVREVNSLLRELNADIVGGMRGTPGTSSGILFLRLRDGTHARMAAELARLRASPVVSYVVQDALIGTAEVPNDDQSYGDWKWDVLPSGGSWGMALIRAPQLWNLNRAVSKRIGKAETAGTRVAVLDGGFTSTHADLAFTNFAPGRNSWHGVHVAGIIGATWGNNLGVDGLDPNATLLAFATRGGVPQSWARVLPVELDRLIRDHRPRVVNVSLAFNWWRYNTSSNTAEFAQTIANQAGGVVHTMLRKLQNDNLALPVIVAVAGNDSDSGLGVQVALYSSPLTNAAIEHGARNIIVVEAIGSNGARAPFSNVGGHLSAPGVDILSTSYPRVDSATTPHTVYHDPYEKASGTSMAAPHVAGLVSYLYALDSRLAAPTLTTNPALDVLLASAVDATGGARDRIDAFAAALELDRMRGSPDVLRMLLDVDDGSEDGNLRVDPVTGAAVTELDHDRDGGIGDGRIDMKDFRVWRDGFLQLAGPPGLALDGAADHPKKDLNGNGIVNADELIHPRMDLNGDGIVDLITTARVGGTIGRAVTDLEVLQELFDDVHYRKDQLPALVYSADIAVNPQSVLGESGVQSVRSYVYRVSDGALLEQRLHTGGRPGEGNYQVFTVPTPQPTNQYRIRLLAFDAGADTLFHDSLTVVLGPGQDVYWDPACTPPSGSTQFRSESTVRSGGICEPPCQSVEYVFARTQAELNEYRGVCETRFNVGLLQDASTSDPITDLSPLAQLARVGGNVVIERTALTEITLPALRTIGWVTGVGEFLIENNPRLQQVTLSIDSMIVTSPNSSGNGVRIRGSDALQAITVEVTNGVTKFSVDNAPVLDHLDVRLGAGVAHQVAITRTGLTSIARFAVERVVVDVRGSFGGLYIYENPGLTGIQAFRNVRSVATSLAIRDNPRLCLPDWVHDIDVGGTVFIWGNREDCGG